VKELLFRVFDKEQNLMSKIFPLGYTHIVFNENCLQLSLEYCLTNPDRFIIMQFTGLTTLYDDPAKIFDHDFVKIYFANKSIICLVKWDYDDGGYRFEEVNGDEYYIYSELIHYDDFEKIEILGNVHEHKHLLEAL
jgi:hypothetical protein